MRFVVVTRLYYFSVINDSIVLSISIVISRFLITRFYCIFNMIFIEEF